MALLGKRPPRLIDRREALVGFGGTVMAAREAYLEQVRLVAEARWLEKGVRSLPWWEGVSNDDQLIELEVAGSAVDYRGKTHAVRSERMIGLEDVAAVVCKAADTTIEALRGRSRSAEIAASRKAFVIVAVEHLGHRVSDVAEFLHKHPGSVSRWIATTRETDNAPQSMTRILDIASTELDVSSAGM